MKTLTMGFDWKTTIGNNTKRLEDRVLLQTNGDTPTLKELRIKFSENARAELQLPGSHGVQAFILADW